MSEPESNTREAAAEATASSEPEPTEPRASGKEQVASEPPQRVASQGRVRASGGPLDAYEALAKSPRLSDIVLVARKVLGEAAEGRRTKADWAFSSKVNAAADETTLERSAAETPYGNALAVLANGPEDAAEAALACALAAHLVAESARSEHDKVAGDMLWLAAHTAFDATSLVDRALGEDADDLWAAVADRIRQADSGKGALGRAEALVGCAALALSDSAAKRRAELAGQVRDPLLSRVLEGAAEAPSLGEVRLEGQAVAPPRGAVVTTVLAFTGLLFVFGAARLLARFALAYRSPAEVTLSDTGVRVKTRTEMLGKVLREREHVIAKGGLVRVVREVRYPRAAFYAGLLALALGSYVGVRAFVDGVRSASPSLLVVGLLVIAVGVAIDFVLGSLLPGARGRCSIIFVPRVGATVCIADVDAKRADDALRRSLAR